MSSSRIDRDAEHGEKVPARVERAGVNRARGPLGGRGGRRSASTASPPPHEDAERPADRVLSIIEALLLSLVAVLAAFSGYAAAKWSTESSVALAKASADRTKANRADLEGIVTRDARLRLVQRLVHRLHAGNANAERFAEKRLRPGYRPAFNAWLATDPAHNPNAPPGPVLHAPIPHPPGAGDRALDAQADADFAKGAAAGSTADKYVRDTVFPRPCCSWSG